jgi:hypothetical protein
MNNNEETTYIMVKKLKKSAKAKLRLECVKRGIIYAEWIEEKLSTSQDIQ